MSMRRTNRSFTLAASAGFIVLAAGCEDADTQAAVDRGEQIATASRSYSAKLAEQEREQALEALASGLAAGQLSPDAGAVIEALAARDIAAGYLNDAAVLEAENRGDRAAMAGMARGAMRLGAVADKYSAFDQSTDVATIEAAAAEAQGTLQEVQDAIAALERPVADLEQQNLQDRQEVERLRAQARALYEKAFELGDLNGFPDFQNAVDLDKQADAIEDRIVQREIELIDLSSQLAFAQAQSVELQKQIEAAQQAQTALEDSAGQHQQNAANLEGRSGDIGRAFNEALDRVQERMDRLTGIYDQASAKLDTAIAKSGSAGGAEAGAIIKVRALQLRGELNDAKARGLADHVALLATLSNAGSVGDASQFRSALATATQMMQDADAAATAAYQEAAQALGAVGGNPQQTARLKQQLDAAAGGAPIAPIQPTRGGGMGAAPATPPATGAGAESPEALVAALNAIDQNDPLAAMQAIIALSSPSELPPADRAAFDALVELMGAAAELDQALQAKFGQRLADTDQMFGMLAGMMSAQFTGSTLGDVSGERGTIQTSSDDEPIAQINGRWYLLLEAEPESATDMAEMASAFTSMAAAYRQIRTRIDSGELASIEAVEQALAEVAQMMGGGMNPGN